MNREQALEANKDTCCQMSDELINEIYNSFERRSCDNCKYRVYHGYDNYKKVQIDKCGKREQLHFNGNSDGLCCNKWEQK